MEVIVDDLEPVDSSGFDGIVQWFCMSPFPDVIDDMHICIIEGDLNNDQGSFKNGILGFVTPLISRLEEGPEDDKPKEGPTIAGEVVFDRDGIRFLKYNGIFEDAVKHAMGIIMGPVT